MVRGRSIAEKFSANANDAAKNVVARSTIAAARESGRLARDFLEHLLVGREFFHEHEQTLDGFLGFVTG